MTYEDAFLQGIANNWSGSAGGYNVSVNTGTNANGYEVTINNVISADVNSVSCGNFNGPIDMFIGDGRYGLDSLYTLDDFMSTSAHEFGHSVFHVYDIYTYTDENGNIQKTDQGITTPFTSMMNGPWGIKAQAVDYAIILNNQTWTSTEFVFYSQYGDILDKYIGKGKW